MPGRVAGMGLRSRWRAARMKQPVSGVFRVADWYDARPHGTPPKIILTGVIVADGVPANPVECRADPAGRWTASRELPVVVDRAEPANFYVDWDAVPLPDPAGDARRRAAEAAATLAGRLPGEFGSGPERQDLSGAVGEALRAAGVDPNLLENLAAADGDVRVEVVDATGHLIPGTPGAGATPDQTDAMVAGTYGPTERATAVVIAVHERRPPAAIPKGASMVDLTLDVTRADGSSYAVTTRVGFRTPARRAAVAVVGNRLPVLVDPKRPKRVAIDTGRLNLP